MYFDTHAHYDDDRFTEDRIELLGKMPENGVGLIVNPGCDERSSLAAMELAARFDHVYAAVGWHPQEVASFDGESISKLRQWCAAPKVKAIGEIGLDYFYDCGRKETQRYVFARQMELAAELNLPVIVHDRDAHGDSLEIVERFPEVRGVFHCYSGSAEMAKRLLSLGWYLSFTGAITFKNARKALETIEICPPERIMIETDSPYLTPVPHRGKRNDSRMLPYIAAAIGEVKHCTAQEIAELTWENGKRFFSIE